MATEKETTPYVIPKKGIRDRYKAEPKKVSTGTQVTIYKDTQYDVLSSDVTNEANVTTENKDAERWVEIGTYTRNYPSLLKTFEPFQQFQDGQWHDYALVSSKYHQVEVMDLETGNIVVTETDGKGFCSAEFYVPDWWDFYDESFFIEEAKGRYDDEYQHLTGHFAVYSGCYWGDDSFWKLQYLDLSKMSEGIVTVDNRFGYVELPDNLDIHDAVVYDPSMDMFNVNVPLQFTRNGKARHKGYFNQSINWEEPKK